MDRVEGCTRAGVDIVLVHWLCQTDYQSSSDEAAGLFSNRSSAFAPGCHEQRAERYRFDVLRA